MPTSPPPGFRLLGCAHEPGCADVEACAARDRRPAEPNLDGTPTPDELRRWRAAHGLSQSRAAARVRVGRQVWAAWEQGLHRPAPYLREALILIGRQLGAEDRAT